MSVSKGKRYPIDSEGKFTQSKNSIEFEGGFTGEDLIKHTHVVIVYGDKADTVSNVQLGFGKKQVVQKNKNGRQAKATTIKREKSRKDDKQILNDFKKYVEKLEFAYCEKGYFGVPVSDPDADKQNGAKKTYGYTLFSKKNFQDVIARKNFLMVGIGVFIRNIFNQCVEMLPISDFDWSEMGSFVFVFRIFHYIKKCKCTKNSNGY